MRIIAGRFKGRRLKSPTWDGLRPTSDRLRETLFNVLAPRIQGARVFDGYTGTGAVGIEALSRGASHVVFADADPRATALVAENLALCGVKGGYTIECADVVSTLRSLSPDARFDVIVFDPPYDDEHVTEALEAASARLLESGVVVLERATRFVPDVPVSLIRTRDIRSGDSTLTFMTVPR